MTDQETEHIAQHLLCVGKRAMVMERYLLRRAWGIYYAIWALSILLFIYLPNLLNPIRPVFLQDLVFGAAYSAIIAVSGYFSGVVFSRAARAAKLQGYLSGNFKRNFKDAIINYTTMILLFILVILLATGLFKFFFGVFMESMILVLVAVYVYRWVIRSLGKIPPEAALAIITFILSDIFSTVSVIVTRGAFYYADIWIPTVAAWFLASIISFANAGDELLQNVSQEECN